MEKIVPQLTRLDNFLLNQKVVGYQNIMMYFSALKINLNEKETAYFSNQR